MREYKTQMEAARKGIVTEELKKVAQKEHMRVEELMPLVAAGKVAICANKNHKCLDPQGVGSMLRTKINVNLGAVSYTHLDVYKRQGWNTVRHITKKCPDWYICFPWMTYLFI